MSQAEERPDALDTTFRVSVILKGLDGLLELLGGVILLAVSPATLAGLIRHLTQHELSQDPHDFISRHLLHISENLHKTQLFGALYLVAHGAIKVVLVVGLLKRQRWAYPASLVVLALFIVYQVYRMTFAPSFGLAFLTVFDAFIVWLVWREYRRTLAADADAAADAAAAGA